MFIKVRYSFHYRTQKELWHCFIEELVRPEWAGGREFQQQGTVEKEWGVKSSASGLGGKGNSSTEDWNEMQPERKVGVRPPKNFCGKLKGLELDHQRCRKVLKYFKQKSDVTWLLSKQEAFTEKFFQNGKIQQHVKPHERLTSVG